MDLRLTAVGLLIGTIAGMSGIGGGSLLAPVLILVFGVKASIAVGTDLVYSVPMKALAAFAHARQKTVDGRVVKLLVLGGIPGRWPGWPRSRCCAAMPAGRASTTCCATRSAP